jgi:hypothetical protein
MALRPFRQILATSNEFVGNAAMERGGVVSVASGNVGSYATEASGAVPLGILLNDIEDLNYFTGREQLYRSAHDIGSVLAIATEGEVETDMLDPAVTGTISAGDPAFLSSSGWITTRKQFSEHDVEPIALIVNPRIGVFTSQDHSVRGVGLGWARVRLQIKQGAERNLE